MELKCCLFLLMVCVIHDVQSSDAQWRAFVPSSVPALQGSCVVIPCRYAYPEPPRILLNRWRGFWKKGKRMVSTNLAKSVLPAEYKKRTEFLGNLRLRNCTMLMDKVRSSDAGLFYFRIEMPQYKSFSFTKNAVSIKVTEQPQPPSLSVKVDDKVSASCSVFHSCPYFPPKFSWSRTGAAAKSRTKKVNEWKWETVSTLTFHPQLTDFNKPLNCTVKHRGGKQATSSTVLPKSKNKQ